MRKAAITALGGFVPPKKLTNMELELLVDTSCEWIVGRTGIEERRILENNLPTSYMATEAVLDLCRTAQLNSSEIDCMIVATSTPDMIFPATANIVCKSIGANEAWGFDVSAACSGFLYALTVGAALIETGRYKKVVVVGADKMSSIIDYSDRNTCILFGDGAGAVLLEPNSEGFGFIDSFQKSDAVGREFLKVEVGGNLQQNGKHVFKAAINAMSSACETILRRNEMHVSKIDWLVPHQANIRILEAVAERLEIPKDKVLINLYKYGNTTAATIPLCLWEFSSQLKKGDDVLLTAFGGGYTWGATLLKWAY